MGGNREPTMSTPIDDVLPRFRYGKFQTPRGAVADAEARGRIYVFKNVSELGLTYQVRLLTYRAIQEQRKLILRVPKSSRLSAALGAFVRAHRSNVQIERV